MRRILNFIGCYRAVRRTTPDGIPPLPPRAALRWAWIDTTRAKPGL